MRKTIFGILTLVSLGGFCFARNSAAQQPGRQPSAAVKATGQTGQSQTGQGQTGQGQTGQAEQGRPGQGQSGQAQSGQGQSGQGQPGQVRPGHTQQGQAGQQNQFSQQGQQSTQPGQADGQQRGQAGQHAGGQQGQTARADQEIAAVLYGCASNEIEIAKFAESKAKSEEVREFAKQMVKEHTPGAEEMQQLAGSLASNSGQEGRSEAGQQGRSESGQQGRAEAQGGRLDWVSIQKQIGDRCVASVKKELSAKDSEEFDQCFMKQQIGAHLKAIDELKVLRTHASGDLQQKLDKELETAQHHLEHAKSIASKLDQKTSERITRRPEGNK